MLRNFSPKPANLLGRSSCKRKKRVETTEPLAVSLYRVSPSKEISTPRVVFFRGQLCLFDTEVQALQVVNRPRRAGSLCQATTVSRDVIYCRKGGHCESVGGAHHRYSPYTAFSLAAANWSTWFPLPHLMFEIHPDHAYLLYPAARFRTGF